MPTLRLSFNGAARLALWLAAFPLIAGCGGGASSSGPASDVPTRLSLAAPETQTYSAGGLRQDLSEALTKGSNGQSVDVTVRVTNETSGPLTFVGATDPVTGAFVWTPSVWIFSPNGLMNPPSDVDPGPNARPAETAPTVSVAVGQTLTGTVTYRAKDLPMKGTYHVTTDPSKIFLTTPPTDGAVFVAR